MRFITKVLYAVFLLCSGCVAFAPLNLTSQRYEQRIVWILSDNILSQCSALNPSDKSHLQGCALVKEDICYIYTSVPLSWTDKNITILGHELLHCFGLNH